MDKRWQNILWNMNMIAQLLINRPNWGGLIWHSRIILGLWSIILGAINGRLTRADLINDASNIQIEVAFKKYP